MARLLNCDLKGKDKDDEKHSQLRHGDCRACGFNQEREEREKMNDILSLNINFEKHVLSN